jgi:hypothetical protein
MSGLGTLTPFIPLIASSTGMGQLNQVSMMMDINKLMNLNTGGQGLLSWGGLSNAGNNMYNQSTFLDRMMPSLFSNAAVANTATGLGSFGSTATGLAEAGGGFAGLYGLADFGAAATSAGSNIGSQAGAAGSLGMTGAQALAGIGAVAGVANFAMNPGYGTGISAAGGIMSALAAYGAIGSAFGPIGLAVGVIGALVTTYFEAGKKKGYSGATADFNVKNGLLNLTNVGGKGVDVSQYNQQLMEMTEAVNKANAELNLTIGEGFGEQFTGIGDGAKEARARGTQFDLGNPYLSIAQGGYLKRDGDDLLNSILRNEAPGFNINMSSVDMFGNAVKYYDNYYKTAISTDIAPTSLVQQQRDLRASYSTGISQANLYGFDQQRISTGYATRFNEDTRRGLQRITNPQEAALEDFDKLAAERIETAKMIGADINQVERLNGEERKKIVEQYSSQITNVFRSALKQLTQGTIAGATDASRYNANLAAYSSLLQKYPSASTEDQGRFVEQAVSLVGVARELYSDTPEFAKVYNRVLSDLLQLAPEGSDEGSAAAQALKTLQAGYNGNFDTNLSSIGVNKGTKSAATTPTTQETIADLIASSPVAKDVAAALAPGLVSLGEMISNTNNILREMLEEQRTTNNYIKAVMAQ